MYPEIRYNYIIHLVKVLTALQSAKMDAVMGNSKTYDDD
jgi:hypothetical protein